MCANNTMQADLAICVQSNCNATEQILAATVAQDDICEGIPTPSRSRAIIQCVIVISAITFPIIALRCLSRYLISRHLWWDDWMILLCAVLLVPMAVIPILNANRGFGKHFYNIPPQNIPSLRELYYISQIFYAIVHPAAKISILLLYLRIFPDKTFQLITKIAIGIMVVHILAFVFVVIFQCVPIKSIWDTSIQGRCLNLNLIAYSGGIVSIVEDLIVILLPIRQLTELSFTTKKKIALAFMLSLGSFACITSMVRLKYIVQFNTSIDQTWDDVDSTIWSIIEVYTAVICSCLISLRPLIVKYIPELFSTSQRWKSNISNRVRSSWFGELAWRDRQRGERRLWYEDKPLPNLPITKTTELVVVWMRESQIGLVAPQRTKTMTTIHSNRSFF
ncbi:uncharacterized protein LY89DRAFT_498174 [Mollisia scopiformis]|uniref:Rhodopsin domain-containing protein n=1 Tax=Mollisia scopiformis TaxID=149040 RepID=A0A194XED8_MOLSC|nr:uncharacterized protein LY89DRAFT_498174 [Mollisia scopiformis]KUJ18509.1 hypothetical protein LY89DRAFT_498174 [Mollisia scopiformis]